MTVAATTDLGADLQALIERHGLINVLSTLSRMLDANESKGGIDNSEAKIWRLASNAIEHAHTILLQHFGV